MTIGSSIGNLGNQSSGLNGLPASSNLGMPYDSQSSSVSSVSIPVTPSDVRASVNVAPTSTKQKKKWVHFIVMLSAHFKWGRGGGGVPVTYIWKGWFLVELEFGRVGFWGEGKTGVPGEKPLGAKEKTNNKLKPHTASTPGFEPGPHRWEASALTTSPLLLPLRHCSFFTTKVSTLISIEGGWLLSRLQYYKISDI